MTIWNVTLLTQTAMRASGMESDTAAGAVRIAMNLTHPADIVDEARDGMVPDRVYHNDEIQFAMVDRIRGDAVERLFGVNVREPGPDPAKAEGADIVATTWFMIDGQSDLCGLIKHCQAVITAAEDSNAKAKIVGTALAAAIHNLQAALQNDIPPILPEKEAETASTHETR